jgi:predicted metal-binding membrane protein
MLAAMLLVLAGLAWVATDRMTVGMDAGPGTNPGDPGFFLGTWIVMMVAMMLPSIAPMVLAYRDLGHQPASRQGAIPGAVGLFLAGYLAVWVAAGLVGYALLQTGRSLDGGAFGWDRAGRWVAAGVLAAAALYQLTPSKRECLARCRSRHASLLNDWRDGREGALRMGIDHGRWCLGCCWALMAALFALGAMSVMWMLLISALIAAERLLPWRASATTAVALLLAALAIGVAAAPGRVPMLTIPGSSAAMRAMGISPPRHMRMPEPVCAPGAAERSRESICPRRSPRWHDQRGRGARENRRTGAEDRDEQRRIQ